MPLQTQQMDQIPILEQDQFKDVPFLRTYEHFPPTFLQNICENRSKGDVVFVIEITKSNILTNAFKYPILERTRKKYFHQVNALTLFS
jgi:hypothetical protein